MPDYSTCNGCGCRWPDWTLCPERRRQMGWWNNDIRKQQGASLDADVPKAAFDPMEREGAMVIEEFAPRNKVLHLTFKGPWKHRTISGDAVEEMSSWCLYTDDHERFLKDPPMGVDGRCSACLHMLGVTEVNGHII